MLGDLALILELRCEILLFRDRRTRADRVTRDRLPAWRSGDEEAIADEISKMKRIIYP